MTITISSKDNEKQFNGKEIVNIGSNTDCDYTLNVGYDFVLTIQFDTKTGTAVQTVVPQSVEKVQLDWAFSHFCGKIK